MKSAVGYLCLGLVFGVLLTTLVIERPVQAQQSPAYRARLEISLQNNKTGGTLWAFCEGENRVYVHMVGKDAVMAVVPSVACR